MDYDIERLEGERRQMIEGDTMVEMEKTAEIIRFAEGLGYGEGAISHAEIAEKAGPEVIQKVEETIANPEEILVDVGVDSEGAMLDDDGCGDGRGIAKILHRGKEIATNLNRHRAKVFGGGVAMASSMLVGVGLAKFKGENNLKNVFKGGISLLQDKGIGFGAHTDTHAAEKAAEEPHVHNPNCGCGALDKAPQAMRNAVKYKDNIIGSIEALGLDTTGLDEVYSEYETFVAQMDDGDYAGTDIKDEIKEQGKVTKRLDGDHREGYIILNLIKGKTVNQDKVREISDQVVQTFAVDVWRMIDIAGRTFPDEPELQQKAFLSELIYTLAVGATLTKGDLPVYVIREQEAA